MAFMEHKEDLKGRQQRRAVPVNKAENCQRSDKKKKKLEKSLVCSHVDGIVANMLT